TFPPVGPTVGLEGAVALKVFLRPRVSISIYDLGGPGIALVPYARFDASFDGGTCQPASYQLAAGMDIELSGDMGGFGVPCIPPALADFSVADTILAQGSSG